MKIMSVDSSSYVLGSRILFIEGSKVYAEMTIPNISKNTIAELAISHDVQLIILKGTNDFYKNTEKFLSDYSAQWEVQVVH